MRSPSDSYSLPPAVRRVASAFRLTGLISFWAQLILAVVSTLVLLFASFSLTARAAGNVSSGSGAIPGLFLAVLGLLALYGGAYWAFSYIQISRKLKSPDSRTRPRRSDATQKLRLGLIINLVGMLFTLLGIQSTVGALLAKSLAQPQGGAIFAERITQFVQPLDIFIVQANTNIILAHFIGVVASLWLIRSMNRP